MSELTGHAGMPGLVTFDAVYSYHTKLVLGGHWHNPTGGISRF